MGDTVEKTAWLSIFSPFYLGEWLEERFYIARNRQRRLALFYDAGHAEELTESPD